MEKIIEAIAKAKAGGKRPPPPLENWRHELATNLEARDGYYSSTSIVTLDSAHLEKNRIIAFERSDPKAASFDMLRTQIVQKMNENKWQTLAVTSPTAGCGKTVTAVNLAFSVARQAGPMVVLVDLDLRKPNIADCLGIAEERSLFDYLHGEADLTDILVNLGVDSLLVLANNEPVRNPSEIISSHRVRDMVAELRQLFPSGIFIFDLPPMLVTDDVIAFFPQVDCTLLLVASGQSTVSEIENCEVHMKSTNFLGVVLNKYEGTTEAYY